MSHSTIAHQFADALNARDLDRFDDFISAERYRNHNPFVEDGVENVKATFAMFLQAFPDLRVTLEDALTSGDKVVRFTYRGTHQGEFMGNPATGDSITMRSIDIWRVEDGKAAEHWDEINTLEFFTQLDALPPS